jgi:hypothetical protein
MIRNARVQTALENLRLETETWQGKRQNPTEMSIDPMEAYLVAQTFGTWKAYSSHGLNHQPVSNLQYYLEPR